MAASISGQERGPVSGQAKIDVLLVGDGPVQPLADVVQKFLSDLAAVTVTVTVGDVQGAAELLAEHEFQLVFLRVTSPTAGEREAARSLRFGRKKNTHFLCVFIIPEQFKGLGADITVTEPLTAEKLGVVGTCWRTHLAHTVTRENSAAEEECGPPLRESCSEPRGHFSADPFACSESLRHDPGLELKAPLSDFERSKRTSLLHSSKEKLRRTAPETPPQSAQNSSKPSCRTPGVDQFSCSRAVCQPRFSVTFLCHSELQSRGNSLAVPAIQAIAQSRERIKHSCAQLRALVPGGAGRKNDAASVLEATVEHVKRVRDRIPPAVLGQIAEALQSNSRFCKKPAPFQPPRPSLATAPRENSALASTHPSVRESSFPATRCLNGHPAPASGGGPSGGSVRGPPSPAPEKAAGEVHQGQAPSPALSLSSFHAIRCCPTVVPAWDTAATTNQSASGPLPAPGPRASACPPPHCSSALGQACAAPPACLPSFWAFP